MKGGVIRTATISSDIRDSLTITPSCGRGAESDPDGDRRGFPGILFRLFGVTGPEMH